MITLLGVHSSKIPVQTVRCTDNRRVGTQTTDRRKFALTASISVLATGATGWLVASHADAVLAAASNVQLWLFLVTMAIGVVALMLRSEIWGVCLSAAGGSSTRSQMHAANSFGMLGNSFNHYVGPLIRVGLLRRLAPDTSPKPCQMMAADVPVLIAEASLLILLLATAVGAAGLPWWLPLAGAGGIGLLVSFVWSIRHRFAHRQSYQGLNVIMNKKLATRMLALVFCAIALQVLRTYLLLDAVGLHPAFWQVVMTFCATGILGILPLGPATSSGATMAVFAAQSTAAAAAAGVVLTASAFAASLLYAAYGAFVLIRMAISKRMSPATA
jgi:hypothetical protein